MVVLVELDTSRVLHRPGMDSIPANAGVHRIEIELGYLVFLVPVPSDRGQVCVACKALADGVDAVVKVIKVAATTAECGISSLLDFGIMFRPKSIANEVLL